jgi:hypothetical protein
MTASHPDNGIGFSKLERIDKQRKRHDEEDQSNDHQLTTRSDQARSQAANRGDAIDHR